MWISAHTGIHGNEKADELAKQATTSQLMHSYSPEIINFYNSAKVYTKLYSGKHYGTMEKKGDIAFSSFLK